MTHQEFVDMQIAFREKYPEWALKPCGYEFNRAHEDGIIDDTEYADAIDHYHRAIDIKEEFHRFLVELRTALLEEP